MTDTDLLRGLLEQAAPDRPDLDAPSRAAAVARRGRNVRVRDRALVAVAAVSVVAVVVAVRGVPGGDDGPDRVTPAPPVVQAEPCPAQPVDVSTPMGVLDLEDVVAVRACPAQDAQGDPLPTEALVGDAAAAFAEDVEALPAYEMPSQCAVMNLAPQPWALQVQTGDGTTYVVGSTLRSCSSLAIGGVERGDGAVVAAFEGNLDRQQSGAPGPLSCTAGEQLYEGPRTGTWNASFAPATATAGIVCFRPDPNGSREYVRWVGTLTDDQLATIREDLAAHLDSTPPDGTCTDTGPQRLLVLENAEGDRAAYIDGSCTGTFGSARGYWKPSAASEDAIAAALGGRLNR
ncbi:hypothetical protein [Nocardioides mangrovi]|uniref:Serine/threonine protein kinase n=1 Tax=Nocardioides mangrovi TaxID=2874580 RepID=A0ABS7UIP8_9ACTN|nr:hypothetical protein [Nocardioides mangrovi]MBZ5740906.1 hypothetical protein [Nocardioides mangrovi]